MSPPRLAPEMRGDDGPSALNTARWGYAIAAASVGVRHKIIRQYQIEPNAYAGTSATFNDDYYIFHYTYGIEYRLSGQPQARSAPRPSRRAHAHATSPPASP